MNLKQKFFSNEFIIIIQFNKPCYNYTITFQTVHFTADEKLKDYIMMKNYKN